MWMDGKEPVEVCWLKLRTGKNSHSISEFFEKSEETRVQGTDRGLALHGSRVYMPLPLKLEE